MHPNRYNAENPRRFWARRDAVGQQDISCGWRISFLANLEPIVVEWESFARSVWPPGTNIAAPAEVRDHAEAILRATVRDMMSPQTAGEQSEKAKGHRDQGADIEGLIHVSALHASDRVASGFEVQTVVAEYRAPRQRHPAVARQSSQAPRRGCG
jgi:hypothetical protein